MSIMGQLLDQYKSLANILAEIIKLPRDGLFEFSYYFPKSIELFTFDREALPGLFAYLADVITTQYKDHHMIINSQVQFIEGLFEAETETLNNFYEAVITAFYTIKQAKKAFFYVDKWIDLHEITGHTEKKAKGLYTRGILFHHLSGNMEEAEKNYKKAYEMVTTSNDLALRDTLVYTLATFYQHYLTDFSTSFKYYSSGVKLAEQTGNLERKAFFLGHLGMVRFWQERYSEAQDYCAQARTLISNPEKNDLTLYFGVQDAEILVKLEEYEPALQKLLSVRNLKERNTDNITHTIFLYLLSEIAREIPEHFHEQRQLLAPIIGEVSTEQELLDMAQTFAKSKEHPESIGRSGFYKAKMLWNSEQKEEAIHLLKKTRLDAEKHHRGQPILLINTFMKEKNISL